MNSAPKPGQPEYSNYIISNDESDNVRSLIKFYNFKNPSIKLTANWRQEADQVAFKAYVTAFSDDFSSNWSSTNVYGRMDPVYNYENTTRKITISFDVPSFDVEEAAWNSTKLAKLIQYTYPTYNATNDNNLYKQGINRHIVQAPIIAAHFGNLMQGFNPSLPLPGFLEGASVTPDIEAGVFEYREDSSLSTSVASALTMNLADIKGSKSATKGLIKQQAAGITVGQEYYFFKLYKVNLTFNPIHSQLLGSSYGQTKAGEMFESFPNGLRMKDLKRRGTPGNSANSKVASPYSNNTF